ncbi:phage holin family protein [Mucilaginibacter sp. 3215]|uniref:phage holin family protein n=1 Tax=Mucilaginibacter sp. 3215 TaxID=3373912 RepID=UPI003D1FBE4E
MIKFFDGLLAFGNKYLLWFLVFITPVHPFLYLIYTLLAFDFFTGIAKCKKLNEPLTSKRMRDTTIKFACYSVAVLASFFIEITFFPGTSLYLTKLIGGYITLTEFKSLLENVSVLTGIDLWTIVQAKVSDYFNTKLKPENKKDDKTN